MASAMIGYIENLSLPEWTLSLSSLGSPNSFTAKSITNRSSSNSLANRSRSPT